MRQAIALGLKFAAYLFIMGVTRPILEHRSLPQALILAAVLTLLLWFADTVVLPRFGNLTALLGDVVMLFLGSRLVLGAMGLTPDPVTLPIAVLAGTAFEFWFHRWLQSTATVE